MIETLVQDTTQYVALPPLSRLSYSANMSRVIKEQLIIKDPGCPKVFWESTAESDLKLRRKKGKQKSWEKVTERERDNEDLER